MDAEHYSVLELLSRQQARLRRGLPQASPVRAPSYRVGARRAGRRAHAAPSRSKAADQDHRLGAGLSLLGSVDLGLRGRQFRLARLLEALEGVDVIRQGRASRDHAGYQSRLADL